MGPQIVVAPDICLRLAAQRERLGRIDERPIVGFAINQAMEDIQHMCLGGDPFGQSQFHSGQNSLLVMVQDQCKDIDHLAVSTRMSQHLFLQLLES